MTLKEYFAAHPKAALGFSGGVDSSYLFWAALHYGTDVRAYYFHTAFQPEFEYRDALRLAADIHASDRLRVIGLDVLRNPDVAGNPADRCYHCKSALFGRLQEVARADGYTLLLDGTNASDQVADRPGMRALQELRVESPLRLCGLTKDKIRVLSREAGLFTWDKPAYACLATRMPTGTPLTAASLALVEHAENALFALGYTDFRVRLLPLASGAFAARVQLPAGQMECAAGRGRTALLEALRPGFETVLLDFTAR